MRLCVRHQGNEARRAVYVWIFPVRGCTVVAPGLHCNALVSATPWQEQCNTFATPTDTFYPAAPVQYSVIQD